MSCTFQSTSPVRGTTSYDGESDLYCVISIHVPREGDDVGREYPLRKGTYFNPRPP